MKKLISIVALFAIIMVGAMSVVNAATSNTLAEQLYTIGSKYGMKASEKVKMERYLDEHNLNDEDCNKILALANQADQIMIDNNTTNYKSLPEDVKGQLRSLANEAADIADVTLDFKSDRVDVYKNGELVEAFTRGSNGRLAYTGNNNIVLVVSSIAVIALVAVVARKKLSNV